MKRSTPNTPNQVKSPVQINSEQKQNLKMNKNKRKSLPASLANGEDGSSLKKKKLEPFLGTSDLFMQMKHENVKKEKGENDKSPAKGKKQKQSSSNTSDKADETKPLGDRRKRRLEKLKARRIAGKTKLRQTVTQARDGDETAINHLKENLTKLLTKEKLTRSSRKKVKLIKKALMEGGVDVSTFNVSSSQTTQKTEKPQNKAAQQKTKSAGPQKGATANTDKKGAAQLQKQNKKQGIKKEIKVEVESDEDDDDSDEESEEENDNSLIEAESIEDEGEEEEDDEEAGEQEESEEGEEDDDEAAEEEDDDDDEEEEDSDEEEVPNKKAKVDKKQNGKPGQNQSNDSVSSLLKGKSRYVLFVGNLPFDVTKEDISQHFAKIGSVKDVRIPLDKQTNKCRGFGYVEMPDQATYEKALSLHHTNLKGRRINVEYTQGGKKKGEDKKKEIKAKNFKLQAMRQGGKLTGSIKQSQKRAARREKRRSANK